MSGAILEVMTSVRLIVAVLVAAALVIAVGSAIAPLHVVVPPVVVAIVVLFGAAWAGDYFGWSRRRVIWRGHQPPSVGARTRLAALEARLQRERDGGDYRAEATARTLLRELGEQGQLARGGIAVDLLGAMAILRPERDRAIVALRAMALAELGRTVEARRLVAVLAEDGSALACLARGRVLEACGELRLAVKALDVAAARLGSEDGEPWIDGALLRAACLDRLGEEAGVVAALGPIAASSRGRVEELAMGTQASLAMAARVALGVGGGFR
jgi:hypothetical protein